ncbi:MAG TPA: M14 family metallopeptidase [Bryobacteraceae bacterium]|nr:M14 family metallopeptidase [Bryobacteraceae bacterium]
MADSGHQLSNLPICSLASGMDLALPLMTIQGTSKGPAVGISGTIHGDEVVGVQVIRDLWRSLRPEEIKGTLLMIPICNPQSLEALSRNNPLDMLDLNRTFPGNDEGWLTERISHALTSQFLNRIDYYIDIHAGGTFPVVDYCYSINDEPFARAFLSQLLYRPRQMYPGVSAAVTQARGVPSVVIELGGGYIGQDQYIARGVRNIRNMLRQAGMLEGEVETRSGQIALDELKVIRPRNGGLCYPAGDHRPGTAWPRGTKLAEIVSMRTFETIEEMETPFEHNVMVLHRNCVTRVNPGDYVFMVGNMATAETLD